MEPKLPGAAIYNAGAIDNAAAIVHAPPIDTALLGKGSFYAIYPRHLPTAPIDGMYPAASVSLPNHM